MPGNLLCPQYPVETLFVRFAGYLWSDRDECAAVVLEHCSLLEYMVTRALCCGMGGGTGFFFPLSDSRLKLFSTAQREICIDKVRMVTSLAGTKYTPRNGSWSRLYPCGVVTCGPDGEPLLGNCIPSCPFPHSSFLFPQFTRNAALQVRRHFACCTTYCSS